MQVVAFVDDHESVELAPLAMVLGFALKLTVGAGEFTVTVADWAALPPAPVQVRVYVVFAVSAPVARDPLVAWLPLQPPEAVQAVALLDDHVRVDAAPLAIVLGAALRVTVAVGVAVTVTVADCAAAPPGPVHVRE